jgi:hypothetical protein
MNLESATITARPDGSQAMTITIVLPTVIDSALHFEQQTQQVLNQCGLAMMSHALKSFDTEGEEIRTGGRSYTSKGIFTETYQCLFGAASIPRHVYQHSGGGKTWCPLEDRARIIGLATPQLAALVSSTYAETNGRAVCRFFAEHHQRDLSLGLVQQLSALTADLVLSKEQKWSYQLTSPPAEVKWIGLGVDGTCAPLCEGSWKQVMVGTITFYDATGAVLEKIYLANAPEDGKATFYERLRREIKAVKQRYPVARWAGISDGARDLRPFLEEHTEVLVLDFFHVSEYVNKAAAAAYPQDSEKALAWVADALHELKHVRGGAEKLIDELEAWISEDSVLKLSKSGLEEVNKGLGYMKANDDRMDYVRAVQEGYPIGSGVTEAACKTLVKARICGSGMKWHEESMQQVLCLRALRQSTDRWEQFWEKLDRQGC